MYVVVCWEGRRRHRLEFNYFFFSLFQIDFLSPLLICIPVISNPNYIRNPEVKNVSKGKSNELKTRQIGGTRRDGESIFKKYHHQKVDSISGGYPPFVVFTCWILTFFVFLLRQVSTIHLYVFHFFIVFLCLVFTS